MKIKISLSLFLVFISSAFSQEKINIDRSIEITLENNLDISFYENNMQIAKNNSSILNNGFLPSITINGDANTNSQDIEIETPSGLSGTLQDSNTDNLSSNFSIIYNLIDGTGRKFNFQKSKELFKKSELEVKEIVENTVLQIYIVYFEVIRLMQEVEIIESNLKISKERLKKKLLDNKYGQISSVELLSAEVDMNNDSITLLSSVQKLNNTKRDLNLLMNVDLSKEFIYMSDYKLLNKEKLISIFENGTVGNTSLLISEKESNISIIDEKRIKSTYLPTVGLIGSYGWNKSVNDNPFAFYNKSIFEGFTAGINIRWNLFNGGSRIISNKNAKINIENYKISRQKLSDELTKEFINAYETHINNLFILEADKTNLKVNEKNFKVNLEKYNLGLLSSIQFRSAQLKLMKAKLSSITSKNNAIISEAYFLKLSGKILSKG